MRKCGAIFFGEFFGTFLLVFFGTFTVAVAVMFNAFSGLLQVATVWGVGVTLAIYCTRHLSCAHLNPAVTLAMVVAGRMRCRLLPLYMTSQILGGIFAGLALFLLCNGPISNFEAIHGIIRGTAGSVKTAMFFGEYFPNPGNTISGLKVTMPMAMTVEAAGTFLLVTMIFLLTEGCNVGRPTDGSSPVFIGATVTGIISIFAPLTQAGINPARDFGPRLVAYFCGWKHIAIPGPYHGFFWVYILAPLLGGIAAALCFRFAITKMMNKVNNGTICESSADV